MPVLFILMVTEIFDRWFQMHSSLKTFYRLGRIDLSRLNLFKYGFGIHFTYWMEIVSSKIRDNPLR